MTQSARDVIAHALSGITWAAHYEAADKILSALTAAGYPVEALPQMREALEAAIPHLREHTVCTAMRVGGNVAECQAHGGAVHAFALAKQEQP